MVGVREARRLSILVDVQDRASAQLAGINGIAQKASNSFDNTAKSANRLKASLAGWAAIAGASALAMNRMIRLGSNLDRTFSVIEEASNASAQQMEAMRDKTRQLGAEMPVTMDEVTRAFEQFTYAGFDAQQAMDASTGAVELAVAGQMDMAKAVETTTSILNAFNLEAEQAGYVSTTLATTFANSAIEIEEIGSAMQYAAQQMSGMGFAATETAAAIGVMADQGMKGTMAGTSLNQAFSQLISSTGKAQEALSAAGLSIEEDFTDQEGNMKSMTEIIELLSEKAQYLNEHQLMEWLEDLAGRRGARALRPLIENFEEFEEKVTANAMGALKEFTSAVDDAEEARMRLIFEAEDPEQVKEQLEGMSDEAVIQWAQQEDIDLGQIEDGMDLIEEMRERSDEMSEEEMTERLEQMFDMETQTAKELTALIQDQETSLEELEEAYEEATTGGELAGAQMDTVSGQLEYLRGSLSSVMYTMYEGFRPAVKAALRILITFTDAISGNTRALKALGAAMFLIGSYATVQLGRILALWVAHTQYFAAISASTGATWAYVTSLGAATKAALAKLAATHSLNAATSTLIVHLFKGQSAALRSAAANIMHAQSNITLLGTIKAVTAGLYAQASAWVAAYWPLLLLAGGLLLIIAYYRDWLGIQEDVNAAISRIGDAIEYTVAKIRQLVSWFHDLNIVGKLVIGVLVGLVSWPLAIAGAIAYLAYWISDALGLFEQFGGVTGWLVSKLGSLAGVVWKIDDAIAWFFEGLAGHVRTGIGIIEYFGGVFEENTQIAADALRALFSPLGGLVGMLTSVEAASLLLVSATAPLTGGLVSASGAVDKLTSKLPDISALGDAFGWLRENVFTLENAFLLLLGAVFPVIKPAIYLYKVLNYFGVIPSIFETIRGAITTVGSVIASVTELARTLVTAMVDGLRTIATLTGRVTDALGLLKLAFAPVLLPLLAIHTVFTALGDDGEAVLETLYESMYDFYEPILEVLSGLENVWELLRDIAFSPFDLSLDFGFNAPSAGDIWNWAEETEKKLRNAYENAVDPEEWGETHRELIKQKWDGIEQAITTHSIWQTLEELEDKLFGWIPDASDAENWAEKTRDALTKVVEAITSHDIWDIDMGSIWDGITDGPDEEPSEEAEDATRGSTDDGDAEPPSTPQGPSGGGYTGPMAFQTRVGSHIDYLGGATDTLGTLSQRNPAGSLKTAAARLGEAADRLMRAADSSPSQPAGKPMHQRTTGLGSTLKRLSSSAEEMASVKPRPTGAGGMRGDRMRPGAKPIEYIDERKVDISQDPTIDVTLTGSDIDRGALRRQIEQAMEEARHRAIEDIIDFITLGEDVPFGERGSGSGGDGGDGDGGDGSGGSGGDPPEGDAPDDIGETNGDGSDESFDYEESSSPDEIYDVNDVRGSAEPTYDTLDE